MTRENAEREAKLRLFHRLLMSYIDFQQAYWIASYILDHNLQQKVERLRGKRRYHIKLLWQALNCAMVVSYCRPFSGNDPRAVRRIPDLPRRFLHVLSPDEKELHRLAMQDRNTMLAHSDSETWDLRTFFMETEAGRKVLLPVHNDTGAPLVHHAVAQLRGMCAKLMEVVFQERHRLEKDLADVLPTVTAEDLRRIGEGSESK